jgi:hypothetical protein
MAATELCADEFCDILVIHYVRNPTGLQPTCDGYGAAFSARHTFSCAKDGLVIIRHSEIRDEICDMAAKSFTPSTVRNEPKINLCCAAKEGTCNPSTTTEDRRQIKCSNSRRMGARNRLHSGCTGDGHRRKNLQRQRSI